MKKYLVILVFVSACTLDIKHQTQTWKNVSFKEIKIINFGYDSSLEIKYKKAFEAFNVDARLKPKDGFESFRVFRMLNLKAIDSDTLKFLTDYSIWENPEKTNKNDKKFLLQFEISLLDIDTNNITVTTDGDVKRINLVGADNTEIGRWSKFQKNPDKLLWTVPTKSATYMVYTSQEGITENYLSYKMIDPTNQKTLDYVNSPKDSIESMKIIESQIAVLKQLCRQAYKTNANNR
jgi:hypothetical protein